MATEPARRPALLCSESTPAAAARIRVVIDELIDLILGLQLATSAAMPGLSTCLALLTLPRISSLAFALASARRCARVFGGSIDGGFELVRES